MSDKLKEHVYRQREDFEVFNFDIAEGWKELNQKLDSTQPQKHVRLWKSIAAAASILLVASLSYIFIQADQGYSYPSELVEAQYFYQQRIDQKIQLVKDKSGSTQIIKDLEKLDLAFEELKADLKDEVHNEAVITAMIDNYRLKLKILEEILMELEEQEDESYPNI